MPETQISSAPGQVTLGFASSLGGNTGEATRLVMGAVSGATVLDTERGFPDATSTPPQYLPPMGSANDPRTIPAHGLQDVSVAVPTPSDGSSILAPSVSLNVLSAVSPSGPAHGPSAVQLDASLTILPDILSTVASDVSSTVASDVSSTVASDVSPPIPSDVLSTFPSSGSAPGSRPLPSSPTVSSIALGGSRDLSPSKQPGVDSFPRQPLNTPWTFPQNYPPVFPTNDFSIAPPEASSGYSLGVQSGDDAGIGGRSDWTMVSGQTGVDAPSTSHVSTTRFCDLPDSQLSVDLDADGDADCSSDQNAIGRVSAASLALIKEEFVEVQKRAKAVAEKTGMSPAQVLQHWSTAGARTHIKRNAWNLYSSYFRENEKEELLRLPERKSMIVNRKAFRLTQSFL